MVHGHESMGWSLISDFDMRDSVAFDPSNAMTGVFGFARMIPHFLPSSYFSSYFLTSNSNSVSFTTRAHAHFRIPFLSSRAIDTLPSSITLTQSKIPYHYATLPER